MRVSIKYIFLFLITIILFYFYFTFVKNNQLTIIYYSGISYDKNAYDDFNHFNQKLEKYFIKYDSTINFKKLENSSMDGLGYIILYRGEKKVFSGVYTDTDIIMIVNKIKDNWV